MSKTVSPQGGRLSARRNRFLGAAVLTVGLVLVGGAGRAPVMAAEGLVTPGDGLVPHYTLDGEGEIAVLVGPCTERVLFVAGSSPPPNGDDSLLDALRERGVTPVTVDVSEFLKKGGGSVKCMIGDLGVVLGA